MMPPFLLAIAAFLLFGLATDRHHPKRWGRRCPHGRAVAMRTGAWGCLAAGFALSLLARGAVTGPIAWVAATMMAAAAVFALLNVAAGRRTGRRA